MGLGLVPALCALLLAAPALPAEEPALEPRVDAIARAALAAGAPGLQIAVIRKGAVVIDRAWGSANLELGVPLAPDHRLRIGSITKQFTAAAVLSLAAQGRLRLDQPVSDFLPDLPAPARAATLRQLLTHVSGIHNYTALPDFWPRDAWLPLTAPAVVELFKSLPLDFPAGSAWRYSNSGYHLLGLALEKAAGRPYAQAVRELAVAPAGLQATGYCDDQELVPRRAAGYELRDGKTVNASPIRMTIPFSAGGLCSTALEVARFALALEQGKVVPREQYAQMTTPVRTSDGAQHPYGFGLSLAPFEGHARVGHGGGINGFASQQGRYPADDLTVAVLVNANGGAADLVEQRVARAALGLPEPRFEDLPVAEADQKAIAGVYLFNGKDRYQIRFEQGRALGHQLGAAEGKDDRLYHQGGLVFAEKESLERIRFNRAGAKVTSLSVGDGTRWFVEAPKEAAPAP